jgi:hypothetical protein
MIQNNLGAILVLAGVITGFILAHVGFATGRRSSRSGGSRS